MHVVSLKQVGPSLALRLFHNCPAVEGSLALAIDADPQRVVGCALALAHQHGRAQQHDDGERCQVEFRHDSHMATILLNPVEKIISLQRPANRRIYPKRR